MNPELSGFIEKHIVGDTNPAPKPEQRSELLNKVTAEYAGEQLMEQMDRLRKDYKDSVLTTFMVTKKTLPENQDLYDYLMSGMEDNIAAAMNKLADEKSEFTPYNADRSLNDVLAQKTNDYKELN